MAWLKDRNGAAKRIQALQEAKNYVDFWTAAKSALPSSPEAEAELAKHVAIAKQTVETRGTYQPGSNTRLWSQLGGIIVGNVGLEGIIAAVYFGVRRLIDSHEPSAWIIAFLKWSTGIAACFIAISFLVQAVKIVLNNKIKMPGKSEAVRDA